MKNTSKTRLWALLQLSLALTGIHTDIHGREHENVFSRSWAWLKEQVPSIGQGLKRSRPKRPSKRLAYKAAHLNDLVGPSMSQEDKNIFIANIEQLRLLAQYGADGVPEAQYVLQALLLHGKQKVEKSHQAAQLYAEQFAPEQHKTYLCSKNGTNTLALLLMQAPPIVPLMPYAATKHTETALTEQITTVAGKFERQLHQIQKQLTQHEQNPELAKALQEKQKQIEVLDQLLEQKSQDPELQKVLPQIQQKDKELEAQLMHIMQNPGLTPAQKETKMQEILAEYEKFVAQYPAMQSYLELFKQRMQAGQNAQDYVKQLTAQHPDIIQFAQLAQAQQQAIDGLNECVTQLQSVPAAAKQLTDQCNIKLWCEKLQDWFAACKKALKEDAHPENHILHYEQDLKQYKGEWKALCKGWDTIEQYKELKIYNLKKGKWFAQYEHQFEILEQTVDDIRQEANAEITKEFNIPGNVVDALDALSIYNISPKYLLKVHATIIKKAYRKKVLVLHPDKNDNENAQKEFIKIQTAYDQLNNLIDFNPNQLDEEKKELYNLYQDMKNNPKKYLRVKKRKAEAIIDSFEYPQEEEKRLEADILDDKTFMKYYPRALDNAKKHVLRQYALKRYTQEGVQSSEIIFSPRYHDVSKRT